MVLIKPSKSDISVDNVLTETTKKLKPMVSFTFDDGNQSDYDIVLPMFKQYGIRGTFFVARDIIYRDWDTELVMQEEQIKEMADWGQEIGSHTMTHPYLGELTNDELVFELGESKKVIEGITGRPCLTLAYPSGDYNDETMKVASAFYEASRTVNVGNNPYGHYNTQEFKTYWLDSQGVEVVKDAVDKAIANNEWVIISMHRIHKTADESTNNFVITEDELLQVVQHVDSYRPNGLEVVPFYEGARRIKGQMSLNGYQDI